jgi:hypothetical protein
VSDNTFVENGFVAGHVSPSLGKVASAESHIAGEDETKIVGNENPVKMFVPILTEVE